MPATFGSAWVQRELFVARRRSVTGDPRAVVAFPPKWPVRLSIPLKHLAVYQFSPCMITGSSSRLGRCQQVVHVIGHDAYGVQLELVLLARTLEGVQEHFAAGAVAQAEPAVVAADGDVVAIAGLKVARGAGQGPPLSRGQQLAR